MSCHFQHHLHSSRPLCIQADSSFVSFHTFWLDVAEQAAQIQPLEQPVWALWQEDSYEFLVLLFAALQAGKQVLLPPHRVSDLEKELAEQQIYFLKRLPSTAARQPSSFNLMLPFSIRPSCIFILRAQLGSRKRFRAPCNSCSMKSVV